MARKRKSKLSQWVDRIADRLGKSSKFFLVVLLVLCVIEVLVDWNATLYEINVLRAALRQKGENYADLLRKASENALLAYDWAELERLSAGVFEDPEVVYVRFTDVLGNVLYDRLRGDYRAHGREFRRYYLRVMDRDTSGLIADPALLKKRIDESRHADFIQRFTNFENRLIARLSGPPSGKPEPPPRALYQDRLSDRDLSYALGAITAPDGETTGVVIVAFDNDGLNAGTRKKLWKGLAITLFFVALILVQNILSRRGKLRLIQLEAALAAARGAIKNALPSAPEVPGFDVGVALVQADGVGGTIWDTRKTASGETEILIASPEGSGVDAAFASVVLRDLYRELIREGRLPDDPAGIATTLVTAYEASPLGRAMELAIVRLAPNRKVYGVAAGIAAPRPIGDGPPPTLSDTDGSNSPRLRSALHTFDGTLATGLVLFHDGDAEDDPARRLSAEDQRRVAARGGKAQERAEELVDAAAKRARKKPGDDLLALVLLAA